MAFRGCLFALPFALVLNAFLGLLTMLTWNHGAARFHYPAMGFLGGLALEMSIMMVAGFLVMVVAVRGALEIE